MLEKLFYLGIAVMLVWILVMIGALHQYWLPGIMKCFRRVIWIPLLGESLASSMSDLGLAHSADKKKSEANTVAPPSRNGSSNLSLHAITNDNSRLIDEENARTLPGQDSVGGNNTNTNKTLRSVSPKPKKATKIKSNNNGNTQARKITSPDDWDVDDVFVQDGTKSNEFITRVKSMHQTQHSTGPMSKTHAKFHKFSSPDLKHASVATYTATNRNKQKCRPLNSDDSQSSSLIPTSLTSSQLTPPLTRKIKQNKPGSKSSRDSNSPNFRRNRRRSSMCDPASSAPQLDKPTLERSVSNLSTKQHRTKRRKKSPASGGGASSSQSSRRKVSRQQKLEEHSEELIHDAGPFRKDDYSAGNEEQTILISQDNKIAKKTKEVESRVPKTEKRRTNGCILAGGEIDAISTV